MTPQQVLDFYGTAYRFGKETGMSANSLRHWLQWGRVPVQSQVFLHKHTKGRLKAELLEDFDGDV